MKMKRMIAVAALLAAGTSFGAIRAVKWPRKSL